MDDLLFQGLDIMGVMQEAWHEILRQPQCCKAQWCMFVGLAIDHFEEHLLTIKKI